MNPRIQRLIAMGKSRVVEFKTARSALNRDPYHTVCAFLNRDGGDILLGVTDDGSVQGVAPDRIQQVPKNPVIARVFKEIGLADELGSGTRRLFKYCKLYSGSDPKLIEADVFSFSLTLSEAAGPNSVKEIETGAGKASVETSVETSVEIGKTSEKILATIGQNPTLTAADLSRQIGVTKRSIERNIRKLQETGQLRHVGPNKGGHWEVLK